MRHTWCTHIYIFTYIHTYIYVFIHIKIPTHSRTHTHTHQHKKARTQRRGIPIIIMPRGRLRGSDPPYNHCFTSTLLIISVSSDSDFCTLFLRGTCRFSTVNVLMFHASCDYSEMRVRAITPSDDVQIWSSVQIVTKDFLLFFPYWHVLMFSWLQWHGVILGGSTPPHNLCESDDWCEWWIKIYYFFFSTGDALIFSWL